MYETRIRPPLPRPLFLRRLVLHFIGSVLLVVGSLLIGMARYAHYENLDGYDAYLNSAILLGGMGPVNMPQTEGGKIFAGLYSLYAGLVFLVAIGIILAPVLHRMMHKFHWDEKA